MGPSAPRRPLRPDWEEIGTVLLDMDGTLLDKHFDDHFWEEHVPRVWAEKHGIPLERAREEIMSRYRSRERTLAWYDVDHWSEELGLDIPALKNQVEHLIAIHPHVLPFLKWLRATGLPVWMVTNAHAKTLDLKLGKTALGGLFDGVVTSHDFAMPKEDPRFWKLLRERVAYDPARTMLADDTAAILESADRFGIRWLVHLAQPNSKKPPRRSERFFSILSFAEIMPPEGGR